MRRTNRGARWLALGLGVALVGSLAVRDDASAGTAPAGPEPARVRTVAQKAKTKKKTSRPRRGSAKGQAPTETAPAATTAETTPTAADDGTPKFSRDIAPILNANCTGCHNEKDRKGKFDLTSFAKLMKGSDAGPVIVPGKPEESNLVLRIKGEKTPRMPRNNKTLAPETIARIETWVKAGAVLDAGVDPNAPLAKVVPSADALRKAALARTSPEQRASQLETVARERWQNAGAKEAIEATPGAHFIVFGSLPKQRATQLGKELERQYTTLRGLLSRPNAPALDWGDKVSVYVFNDRNHYVEFARSVEKREVEPGDEAHANLGVEAPYVAVADPLNGREEPSARERRGRSKKDDGGGPERTLTGLAVEQLAAAAVNQAGKPPRWLSLGLGASLASRYEPRSPYYRRLRAEVAEQARLGWKTKAQEALGGQMDDAKLRAMGFSLIEWLAAAARPQLPYFVRGMLEGPEKLDDVITQCFGKASREQFLESWLNWMAQSGLYRARR